MIADVTRGPTRPPLARLGGMIGSGLRDLTDDAACLDSAGRWAVLATYEGQLRCARFERWEPAPASVVAGPYRGPAVDDWESSLQRPGFLAAVEAVRDRIGRGDVYQANVCRILSARLPSSSDLAGLHALLAARNPARFEGFLRLPGQCVATASPELLLRRDGREIRTGPIKGTGRTAADLLPKDQAENVMIVDLMRNDLSRVCDPGTVAVPRLLAVEEHPGLVHLVSEVSGRLSDTAGWPELLAALLPPGSVSGAPKSSAVHILRDLEPVLRGPYCGAIGWVDADAGRAELAVGIRTFWTDGGDVLRFGTGAGITWGSSAEREWAETELKAAHLIEVAAGEWPPEV